jgi:hypothetical protein
VARRDFLKFGLLGSMGLTLPNLLRLEARAAEAGTRIDRAKSVIILWMRGGPSQHDMWDPKPAAPEGIKGEFKPIATKVPGIQVSELLPLSARLMDRWAIVRSLGHRPEDGNVGHSDGDQICFTGYRAGRDPDVNVMPSCGSHVAKQFQHLDPGLPAYVMIPEKVPGTGPAWLGRDCAPFETVADPANSGRFTIPNLKLAGGVSPRQLREREQLLRGLDRFEAGEEVKAFAKFQAQALDILTTTRAKDAFAFDGSRRRSRSAMVCSRSSIRAIRSAAVLPNWAQRMLLARRLVEAGVRLVTVDLRWWNFHKQGFDSQRRGFLPRWDRAFTALLEDLEVRGLLASTLVVAWGEIGRTPVVNKDAGRDHWPHVMSAAFAGGGVQGGRVVGASDQKGALPRDNPKRPHDVLATIYRHLDIDTRLNLLDYGGRPHPILPEGKPIEELF